MKTIYVMRELTGGGEEVTIVPVPCRGTVHAVRVVSDREMVATGKIKVGRGDIATAAYIVNTVTVPTGNTAAGTVLDGVPDDDYKGLIFDPDSDTSRENSMWIEDDGTLHDDAATVTIMITFDNSAFVEQKASEVGDD